MIFNSRIVFIKVNFICAAKHLCNILTDISDSLTSNFHCLVTKCSYGAIYKSFFWENVVAISSFELGNWDNHRLWERNWPCFYSMNVCQNCSTSCDDIICYVRHGAMTSFSFNYNLYSTDRWHHSSFFYSYLTFFITRVIMQSVYFVDSIQTTLFYHWLSSSRAFLCRLEK